MDIVLVFLVSLIASFVGSLQAGLVNTTVLFTTWQINAKAGKQVALGGALPEIIYAALACLFTNWILDYFASVSQWFSAITGLILIGVGIYFAHIMKLGTNEKVIDQDSKNYYLQGFALGMVNPQLLLFWSGIRVAINGLGIPFEGWTSVIFFSLGAGIGALILLYSIVSLANKIHAILHEKSSKFAYRNVIIGYLLIISGLWILMKTILPMF